jgi:hypothetical protein
MLARGSGPLQTLLAFRVIQVDKAFRELLVPLEDKDFRVLQDLRAMPVMLVRRVHKALQVRRGSRGDKELKDLKVMLVQ